MFFISEYSFDIEFPNCLKTLNYRPKLLWYVLTQETLLPTSNMIFQNVQAKYAR